MIKGWDIGLMGMKVGGKRRLFVPAHLGYGERQIGAHIPPNSDLHFEIELLEVLTRRLISSAMRLAHRMALRFQLALVGAW